MGRKKKHKADHARVRHFSRSSREVGLFTAPDGSVSQLCNSTRPEILSSPRNAGIPAKQLIPTGR